MRKLRFLFLLAACTSPAYAEIAVRYVGHATVLIQSRDAAVLTDPFWGKKILMGLKRRIAPAIQPAELPQLDFVVVSHTHPDHYDVQMLRNLSTKPTVVMPWGRGAELSRLGFHVVELRPWEVYNAKHLKVTAVPARHMFGHCLGYLIEMDGKKIYFTGDTKLHSGLSKIKDRHIDLMLLPYGGYPVLGSIWTTEQAVEAVQRVNPQTVIPIHWGTFDRWWTSRQPETPDRFIGMLGQAIPQVQAKKLTVGERWAF